MRVLGSSVLALEAIVVLLAIPVALVVVRPERPGLVAGALALLALLCVLAIGAVARPQGPAIGWVVQGLVIASGLIVPAMLVLGAIFALLWFAAVRLGTRADAVRAAGAIGSGDQPATDSAQPPSATSLSDQPPPDQQENS